MAHLEVTITDPQDPDKTVKSYWWQMFFTLATNGDKHGQTAWEVFRKNKNNKKYGAGKNMGRFQMNISDREQTNRLGDVICLDYDDLVTKDEEGIFNLLKSKTVRFNKESVDLSTAKVKKN